MSNEEFIQKVLIEEIGEIKDKHPYLMCMLVSQGIEFLGKTVRPINNGSGWNENQNAKRDFQSAIKLFPSLRKYAEIDIYQRIRCRFCEKMVADDNMVSDNTAHSKGGGAADKDRATVNLNDLYDDFKRAWSGNYEVREALWGYAHYGQFTEVGWLYLDEGCKMLNDGGTMVTMKNPTTGDYSIILETKDAKANQIVNVKVTKGMSKKNLCVWRSTEKEQFVQLADITPKNGKYTLTLEPNSVYSISTVKGQQKGSFADIPQTKSFPIPYSDNFDEYTHPEQWGYLPHYTADLIGAFELTERPDHKGQCLRQVVGEHTNSWAPEWHYYTIIGDSTWHGIIRVLLLKEKLPELLLTNSHCVVFFLIKNLRYLVMPIISCGNIKGIPLGKKGTDFAFNR